MSAFERSKQRRRKALQSIADEQSQRSNPEQQLLLADNTAAARPIHKRQWSEAYVMQGNRSSRGAEPY